MVAKELLLLGDFPESIAMIVRSLMSTDAKAIHADHGTWVETTTPPRRADEF